MEIPKNIFTHWHDAELPASMQEIVDTMQRANPDFTLRVYDNAMCRAFIEQHFESEVLSAYDGLVPESYKSDLWRFCALYKCGGIYMDIKFQLVNGFKLARLLDSEKFCSDVPSGFHDAFGVYTGVIVCRPGNEIMKKCIYQIVENVKKKFYGFNGLYPTGPGLLTTFFNKGDTFDLAYDARTITYKSEPVVSVYKDYRLDQALFGSQVDHYSIMWHKRTIYKA